MTAPPQKKKKQKTSKRKRHRPSIFAVYPIDYEMLMQMKADLTGMPSHMREGNREKKENGFATTMPP